MANDNRRWLYDSLTGKGVNVGTYEQFDSAINDENNLKWVYDAAGKNGLNVGDYDAFVGAMRQQTSDAKQETASPTATDAPAPAGTSSSRGRMSPGARTSSFNERVRQREAARAGTATPAKDPATEDWAQQVAASRGRRNAARQMPAGPSEPEPVQYIQPAEPGNPFPSRDNLKNELDALKAQRDSLSAERQADASVIEEYERRLNEHKNTLDPGSKKNKENEEWLYAHRDEYRAAKNSPRTREAERIAGEIYDIEKVQHQRAEKEARRANREAMGSPEEIIATGRTAFGKDNTGRRDSEYMLRQYADELYAQADQALEQGTKYDPGYRGGALERAWTAVSQFVGEMGNNVDRGSLTMGLSEGLADTKARAIGDKKTEIIDGVLKDMKMSDADVKQLLSSIAMHGDEFERLNEELKQSGAELETMKSTYEDMVRRGDPGAQAYGKKYNRKIEEYNRKLQSEYRPLADEYVAYEKIMNAIDQAVDSGLTEGEKAVLDALEKFTEAKMLTEDAVSTAAKAGAGAEQSAEFMLDFYLTGGLTDAGTKAATRLTTKHLMRKMGKDALSKLAAKGAIQPSLMSQIATDALVSLERTSLMFPRNIKAYGEQLTQYSGKDMLGRYQFDRSHLNAALNTALTQYIEYWSEGFGEYFGAGERALFKSVTKNAPMTTIGQTLKSYRGSVGRYLDKGKFNGMFNEMLEEVVGYGFNALAGWMSGDRVGDEGAMKEFFAGENLATLALSFLPMSAIGAATNISAYSNMKRRYNESVERLTPFIESGAISRKELEGLADNMKEMTPEQVKDRIVEMTDRAREANGGRLPQDFAKSIMGYLEGTFSMSLRNEEWEDSQEKMAIVNAYTANYANPVARDAWDVNQNERTARNAALEAGFTEEDLDNDAWMLGQEAVETRLEGQEEKADILMDYATAKAQAEGLRRGYASQTAAMEEQYDANVRQNLDMNGTVTTATLNVDGKQTEVFIVQKDATVNPDGTVSTPTGDGLVAYRNTEKGAVRTAKADQFSNASTTSTDSVIESANGALRQARETYFQSMQDTPSLKGQSEALANVVGQNVVIDDHEGVYQPVKVERLTEGGSRVVISGDKKAMQGIAERIGMRIPTTPYLEAPVERLFPLLSTEEDGSLTTFDPNPKEETRAAETTAPATQSEDLTDQNVKAKLDGEVKDVHVLGVNEGKVMYEILDQNGNVVETTNKNEADFARAMQEAQAPAVQEETPAPAAEENVPKRGTIPRDEKGRKVYDAEGVSVEDALEDLYNTPGLTEEKVDQYIADMVAKAEAARNPEMGDMTPEEWGAATMEANRVADFWSAMKQAAEARKAAPAPAPAQEQAPAQEEKPAPKPRTAAPAPAGEPTRIDSRRKIVSKARDWQKRTKVKVHLVDSIEDVHDQEAREALEDGRALTGWFSKDTGEVEIYLPNITNTAVLDRTFVHEVVSHKGLEGLLGEEGYAALCDRVWNELMTPEEQQEFMNYNRHLRGTEEFLRRAAADEYIARLSENLDFPDNRSLFQKIVDWVMDILGIEGDVAGIEKRANETAATEAMDRTVLYALLEDSLKRYEAETTRGMRDAETKREIGADIGSAMETGEGNKGQTRFSMKSIVTGGGLSVLEDDGSGNVAFVSADGRKFDAEHPITADDLKGLGNTVMGYMMKDARDHAGLRPELETRIWQAYADQLNAFLQKGVAKDGLSGADRLKALWQWEVENSVYRSVATNGDAQYSYSIDITRVCKKNEAVIKAISAMQSKVGYGLTPGQIMDIYMAGIEEGYQVPCPVCYVFSRYIRNGIVATVAINGQKKYGKYLVDPSTLTEKEKQARIKFWHDELKKQEKLNEKNKKQITKAKDDCTNIIEEIDRISALVTSGKLSKKEEAQYLRAVKLLDSQYKKAFEVVSQSALTGWIKQFAIREDSNGYQPKGSDKKYSLWEDTFQGFPEEYALDLRLTAETIEKYPAIQRLRNARGSAGGKEIHFASNNDIGDIPMMLGSGNKDNYYQKAVKAQDERERRMWLNKATKRFKDAHKYAQQQSLRGGQRMWSWSDNIERLGPDVFVNLAQLQMLGGALQAYSKQLEGVNLVASMGGYVNGSLMGHGKGWQELTTDDIAVINGQEVLAHDIKDTVTEKVDGKDVQRERFLAKAGAPVIEVDGKKVTLLFDDVVGIDAYGRDRDGRHLKGLFDLNGELDKAGNILVGMNDTHVRAALADPRVFFIIPWHASGNSVHIVQQMLSYLGVDTDIKDYTDYTNVQEEKNMAKGASDKKNLDEVSEEVEQPEEGGIRPEIIKFWEDHKNETDWPVGIEGGIPSGENGELSEQQKHYRELRNAIFLGVKVDTGEKTKDGKRKFKTLSVRDFPEMMKEIEGDAFLSQVLRKVESVVDDKEMTNGDTKFIYPYEYWNEESTYDTADENGARYLEYCRRLGYKPKFVGKLDSKAKDDFGNFAGDKGYWKLLIDRRMYGVDGRFQDLTPTTTENYDPKMVDPEWTRQNFTETKAFDKDEVAERIADRVIEKEAVTFPSGVPSVNYNSDLEKAVKEYERILETTKNLGIKDLIKMATPKAAVEDTEDASADPQVSEGGSTMFRERTAPAPQNTKKVYKLMRLGEDGKLYPLFIDSANPIELKKWYDADSPDLSMLKTMPEGVFLVDYDNGTYTSLEDYKKERGEKLNKWPSVEDVNEATEKGLRWMKISEAKSTNSRYKEKRLYDNIGIDGSGKVSTYAMRPGWHAGTLPTMRQIGLGPRDAKEKFRDDRFVWVEGYVPADVDYNEEAQGNPGQDIPTHIPENGYYKKATNADKKASQADRVDWYVAGSFYPDRIIGDREARQVIDDYNNAPENDGKPKVSYDWPRYNGRVFNAETMSLEDENPEPDGPNGGGTRFREANRNQLGFVSNAAAALDRIKMDKATPEQWQKMLEKEGGMKAGEDKWLGLSDWLASQDKKSITKDEIADYIAQHRIQIEEVRYSENARFKDQPFYADKYDSSESDDVRPANDTRLSYTTEGLENKREIALTVPTIESWGKNDYIHFGDAGNGRAVAWVRFGDTLTNVEAESEWQEFKREMLEKYNGEELVDIYDKMSPEDRRKVISIRNKAMDQRMGKTGRRVLVIDEIQSKRHQEAREQGGYKDDTLIKRAEAKMDAAKDEYDNYVQGLVEKYGGFNEMRSKLTPEENAESKRLYSVYQNARTVFNRNGFDPNEDEEYRRLRAEQQAHENSPEFQQLMKDWTAAMKAGDTDRVAEIQTRLNPFQLENQRLIHKIEDREVELADEFNETHKSKVAAAPFEKNWHELAMKRMLRLAAEEGYDYVAWTKGDQQASRYDLGNAVSKIISRPGEHPVSGEKEFDVEIYGDARAPLYSFIVSNNGVVEAEEEEYDGKNLSDIIGKELANKILSSDDTTVLEGDNLRIGGEGMKGFYDDILPRFMNKYGKKWGIKVSDINLPDLEKSAQTMHAVPVTPEMKESVMQGQTMFREEVNRDAARVKETVNEKAHDLVANRVLDFIKQDIADRKSVTKKDPGVTIRLGLPSGSLIASGVRNQPMVVSEYDLLEASGNGYGDAHHYHPYDLGDLNDLATLINHPVAVFRDKRNPYNRVLLLDRKGRITGREQSRKFDYVAAIASVPVYDANGKRSFVNRILTVFPAESKWKEFYAQLKDLADGNAEVGQDVMWVDNKKISPWVKGHSTSVGAYDTITREDVANIQKSFEDKQDFLRIDAESRQPGGNTRFRVAVDPESQRLFDAAKERFGTTYDVREAGYILPDGTMLDFSGRHWTDDARDNSWLNGMRQVDHRDISDIEFERDGNTPTGLETDMSDFIRRGAIRISYPGSINLAKKPTWDQEEVLEKLIRMDNKFVRVDFGDGTSSDHYADYDYARPANVIDDIYEYFENGVKPNGDTRFREADSGNAATDYENEIRRTTTKILLEFQDADIPVRVAVNKIMNEVAKEHLDESEDYLTRHNLVSSRADAQMHKFKLFYYGPLMDTVGEIEDRLIERTSDDKPGKRARKAAYERIRNYIYAVSALERNAWKNDEADKNRKDALDDIEAQRRKKAEDVEADSRLSRDEKDIALEEVEKWAKKKRSEARRKYARRDWSGITALMGRPKDEWVEAEADATDMVSTFRTELGDEDMLKKLWDGIRACTDFNLEFAYKNGLLTRTEYERFHGTESQPRLWEYYVPLRGFAERTAEDEYSYNMLTNRDTKDTVLKNMKGRVTQADDPIANIRHIAEMGIVQGLNNWAKRALYEFVIDAGKNTLLTPVDYWYIKDDDGNWSPAEPEEDESLEHFEERMVGLMNEDEPRARKGRNGLKLSLLMGNKGHRNAHMIRLKVNGVDKGIWVNGDPVLAKAVNGVPGWNHRVIRGVQKVNRNLAQLYTTLSVKFITKNKMRDTQFSRIAALVGEDQAYLSALEKNWWANNGYVAAAAPMMKMVFDWESGKLEKKENLTEREQMFIDFMYDGGATGYTVMNTMEDIKKDLEKMVENAGSEQRTIPVIGLYAKWVGALNEGAELLTRFTFYQTSREMGRSRERAAYDAKESSVNFNRRGLRSGEGVIGFAAAATGLLYLFFNPAVQGLDKFVRLHKEHPWKMGIVDATYFMMGFVNSMLNAMIAGASDGGGGDDDDKMGPDWYWNIPEWVRRSNIIIGSPFKKLGKWGYLVISLPIEYKGFYAMGELASSLLQKRYAARDAATIANEVVGVVAELLPVNPVEGYTPGDNAAMSVLRNLTPGALAPIVDVATNRSFSGVPLWKENIYDETQPLSQSSFASTPEILNKAVIKLSDATATMPWHIDIPAGAVRGLLKGYGGGAYTFVEDLGKFVFADEAHPRRYENFPIVSGFTGYLEEDRRNSFNNNALQNYKELSKDVVTRIRSVAPEVDEKMVYEHPDDLPPKAKVAMVALKDKWILGQMYYNGIKERSGAMESRVNKRGDVYSASVDDSVKGLRSVWKKKKEEYAKLLEDKNANDQELETARDAMLDAWSAYTDAEDSLVDKLLEEEYYHVQERLKNGIPYEPKRTLGEKAYDLTNKKK